MGNLSVETEEISYESAPYNVKRKVLRAKLYQERCDLLRGGYPICPICRKPITRSTGFHLHEAIITRGDVQRLPKGLRDEIFVPENCVILHPNCHICADTKRGRRICARHLLRTEGYENILKWLVDMNLYGKGVFGEAVQLVYYIQQTRAYETLQSKYRLQAQPSDGFYVLHRGISGI